MLDESSCILLLSQSEKPAFSFVGLVTKKDVSESLIGAPAASQTIPWTISNKYYTADVHFKTLALPENAADVELQADTLNVPAILYIWSHGQPYREHVSQISRILREENLEPEVCLAVRLPPAEPVAETQAGEEDSLIDDFLSSLGFEFVTAYTDGEGPSGTHAALAYLACEIDAGTDIPGLPRALDALSTIMWPSMKPNSRAGGANPQKSGDISVDRARRELSLHFDDDAHQRDLDELARWLDEPEELSPHSDPWRNAASSTAVVTSPTSTTLPDRLRFDDDFTTFVSAQPALRKEASGYGSDFGDSPSVQISEFGELGSDDEDEDLPSEQEIQTTSARIFNAANDEGNFDLSAVLSTLEGMKAEIAAMDDEDARRRAAAKAALGLVYGLDSRGEKEQL